jgi:hypothetical protein
MQPSRMDDPEDEPKPKRPWSPWQYVALIVLAMLFAALVLRPIAVQITSVFQTLTDAFAHQQR